MAQPAAVPTYAEVAASGSASDTNTKGHTETHAYNMQNNNNFNGVSSIAIID